MACGLPARRLDGAIDAARREIFRAERDLPRDAASDVQIRAFIRLWRSLKGRGLVDGEFSDFRQHSIAYLIPALRSRGFVREAQALTLLARLVGARF
jgi:hypothetical protein